MLVGGPVHGQSLQHLIHMIRIDERSDLSPMTSTNTFSSCQRHNYGLDGVIVMSDDKSHPT